MTLEMESTDTVFTLSRGMETMVTIKPDGTLEYGPNYSPDAAAKILWEAVSREAQLMLQLARREARQAAIEEAAKVAEQWINKTDNRAEAIAAAIRRLSSQHQEGGE